MERFSTTWAGLTLAGLILVAGCATGSVAESDEYFGDVPAPNLAPAMPAGPTAGVVPGTTSTPPPADPTLSGIAGAPAEPPIVGGDPAAPPPIGQDPLTPAPDPVGGTNAVTSGEPAIPAVTGECPPFVSGSFSTGGLSGITMDAGPKAAGGGSLIFYWHGTGSFAGEYLGRTSGFMPEFKAAGGVLVSPQGSIGGGGDCSGTATFSKNDFNWADQIVACAVRDHNIDPRRIYTTGCSAGGLQAGCMGALRSSYIAAAVPNSGGFTFPQPFQDSAHIPALMTMHGGSGDNVIVNFGQTSTTAGNAYKGAGGGIWVDCNHMSGHCGAPAALYSAGWEFMKAHPFGIGASPYASALPTSFPSYCQIL